jgi:hypothetical protein
MRRNKCQTQKLVMPPDEQESSRSAAAWRLNPGAKRYQKQRLKRNGRGMFGRGISGKSFSIPLPIIPLPIPANYSPCL